MPQTISQEGLKEHLNQIEVFRLANMVWGDLRIKHKHVQKLTTQKGEGVFGCHFVNQMKNITQFFFLKSWPYAYIIHLTIVNDCKCNLIRVYTDLYYMQKLETLSWPCSYHWFSNWSESHMFEMGCLFSSR